MPLSAEVLPQLFHCTLLSGQPEAQRGLWLLRDGTLQAAATKRCLFGTINQGWLGQGCAVPCP